MTQINQTPIHLLDEISGEIDDGNLKRGSDVVGQSWRTVVQYHVERIDLVGHVQKVSRHFAISMDKTEPHHMT